MVNIYFSQFWKLGVQEQGTRQIWCLVKASALNSMFLLCPPHMAEEVQKFCGVPFVRALIPFGKLPRHDLRAPQRPPLLCHHVGGLDSIERFFRQVDIQSKIVTMFLVSRKRLDGTLGDKLCRLVMCISS